METTGNKAWARHMSLKKIILLSFIIGTITVLFVKKDNLLIEHFVTPDDQSASLVFMSALERTIISAYLNKSHTMLEYGSGYSTLYFSQLVHSYYSVEHDRNWYKRLSNLIDRSPKLYSAIRRYVLVSVEPGYKGWPGGYTEGTRQQFELYVTAIRTLPLKKYDRVLIDGRARVACMEEVYSYLHKDSILFVHDFTYRPYQSNTTRERYKLLLQTFQGQTLAVFQPRL